MGDRISRRGFLATVGGLALGARAETRDRPFRLGIDSMLTRIAFGSCISQRRDQHILAAIAAKRPDVFVMLGDGVYPEHEGEERPVLEQLELAYRHARSRSEIDDFRSQIETIAIWDDNDYGGSDIGHTFGHKERSRELFLDYWCGPDEASTRRRDSGIYGLWEFGPDERRTQIIVPDLRYCRSEWAQTEESVRQKLSSAGFGPYKTRLEDGVTMLGDSQWQWLEGCLRRPAAVRILASSIQLVPEGRGWESWSNFPTEKRRLLDTIRSAGADNLVVISGDTHYGEFSVDDRSSAGFPLWEFTSSGLTESWPAPGPNPQRVGAAFPQTNFGLLTINWAARQPLLVAELYDETGSPLRQHSLELRDLVRKNT